MGDDDDGDSGSDFQISESEQSEVDSGSDYKPRRSRRERGVLYDEDFVFDGSGSEDETKRKDKTYRDESFESEPTESDESYGKNANLLLVEKSQLLGKKLPLKENQLRKNPPRRKSDLWLLMMMTLKIQILKQKIEKGDIWLKKKLNGKHVEYN